MMTKFHLLEPIHTKNDNHIDNYNLNYSILAPTPTDDKIVYYKHALLFCCQYGPKSLYE